MNKDQLEKLSEVYEKGSVLFDEYLAAREKKDSAYYFMTKMTQDEFESLAKQHVSDGRIPYSFNLIKGKL